MDMDYTLLCVIVIVMIGVAISIYSMCKGCSGLQERGMSARTFFTPTSVIVQQLRARQTHSGEPYIISGSAVQDKNPPLYEELFAPPPSYEETMQMIKALSEAKAKPPPTLSHPEAEQVNLVIHPEHVHCVEQNITTTTNEKETYKNSKADTTTDKRSSTPNITTELTNTSEHHLGSCSIRIEEM